MDSSIGDGAHVVIEGWDQQTITVDTPTQTSWSSTTVVYTHMGKANGSKQAARMFGVVLHRPPTKQDALLSFEQALCYQ